jgi:hypothetical protein
MHILQELHKISLMNGWQDNMLASGQEGANAGPAAVPAVQLDQHRLPVKLDRAAAARMLPLPVTCGLQNHIKASTHNTFKFGTALQKLALTYLLQYAEYARKYARKYAEYDK